MIKSVIEPIAGKLGITTVYVKMLLIGIAFDLIAVFCLFSQENVIGFVLFLVAGTLSKLSFFKKLISNRAR